ncbi:hypothetical protein IFM89_003722 [Coptis chinensis]|uniref:Epidermal patterning factor-like protein n=1 Tax=Coptis chinensis TaxID=261450 RepID=A0A835I0T7_9MAGN|nr:hypothetical protein IFM89_003722 [Coptis chinensis]
MRWSSRTMSLNHELLQTTAVFIFILHLLCFQASCFHQQPPSTLQRGVVTEEKMRLGSRPPSCYNRCSECHPCMAVQVPTTPIQPGNGPLVPLNKHDKFLSSTTSKKYTNYKPLGWKCRCGNHLFNP